MPSLVDLMFRAVDGLFAVDARQRIILWSPGCAQLLGIPATAALGRSCGAVLRGRDADGKPLCDGGCCIARLAQGGNAPGTFSLRVPDANGQDQLLSVSIVLVPSLRRENWCCVHLLRRGKALDPLALLESGAAPTLGAGGCRSAQASPLSAREQEILCLLAEGLSPATISRLLKISVVTVRNHVQHIQAKLGVHSQAETVAYAYRHRLV